MNRRWALFLSGRGSTAQALLDQIQGLDIRLVVSSRAKAPGLLRAKRSGVPTLNFTKNQTYASLHEELLARRINSIFLVGFMKILPPEFVGLWRGRIWNVHPSLLPAYPGAQALEKSFADQKAMGVSIHEVTSEMDAGPLRLQSPIKRDADFEVTRLRVARLEQRLLREWSYRVELRWGRYS